MELLLSGLDFLKAWLGVQSFAKCCHSKSFLVAEKIAFGSREELIGQLNLLKKLHKHPDTQNRIAPYFALVPDILKGLRDPNIDVNVQALDALRYLSRKPNGFGMTSSAALKGRGKEMASQNIAARQICIGP